MRLRDVGCTLPWLRFQQDYSAIIDSNLTCIASRDFVGQRVDSVRAACLSFSCIASARKS